MVLQKKFVKSQETAVASFSYTDIAEGTGVTSFYAFRTRDTTAVDYKLSGQQPFCEDEDVANSLGAELQMNTGLTREIDFDLSLFNMPKTIKGTMRCQLPTHQLGGVNNTYYFQVKLRKWDGTTETEIANNTSKTYVVPNSFNFIVMDIDVPQTHFKKGEILRVTIIQWDNEGGAACYLGISPQNLATTHFTPGTNIPTSTCKFDIPFLLDL